MKYPLLILSLLLLIIGLLLSCGESNPVVSDETTYPDTIIVIDPTSILATPANIHIDSMAILDTVYNYESCDTNFCFVIDSTKIDSSDTIEIINDTTPIFGIDTFAHWDTSITITKIELDSILASFITRWDPVTNEKIAERYFVYVHDSTTGDLIRILKAYENRLYVGGLKPNNTYKFNIAAVWDTLYDTTIGTETKKVLRAAISEKSDFRYVRLHLPGPPGNLKVTYTNNTAIISWDPYSNGGVLGYKVFLLDMQGTVIDSTDTLDANISSTSFNVQRNSAYKITSITIDSIGVSVIDSLYPYDISTTLDNDFKLPYIYLSTYEKPQNQSGINTGNMIGIKGGVFVMGNVWVDSTGGHPGKPAHEVVVSSFYLGEKEITTGEYIQFVNQQKQAGLLTDTTDTLIEYDTNIVELYDTTFNYDTTYDTLYHVTSIDTSYDTLYDTTTISPVDTIIDTLVNTLYDTTFDSSVVVGVDSIIDSTVDSTTYIGADTTVETIYVDTMTIYVSSISDNDTFMINPKYIYIDSTTDTIAIDSGRHLFPISGVYWTGAAAYCNWLSQKEGLNPCYNTTTWDYDSTANGYRLPTEAEFEYAHSAAFWGNRQRYPWGYKGDANKYSSDTASTKSVGTYSAYFGLYDLSGNIMEWCNDWSDMKPNVDSSSYYGECLAKGVVVNPLGPSYGDYHALRGGSHKSMGDANSSAWRHQFNKFTFGQNGFRVARCKK